MADSDFFSLENLLPKLLGGGIGAASGALSDDPTLLSSFVDATQDPNLPGVPSLSVDPGSLLAQGVGRNDILFNAQADLARQGTQLGPAALIQPGLSVGGGILPFTPTGLGVEDVGFTQRQGLDFGPLGGPTSGGEHVGLPGPGGGGGFGGGGSPPGGGGPPGGGPPGGGPPGGGQPPTGLPPTGLSTPSGTQINWLKTILGFLGGGGGMTALEFMNFLNPPPDPAPNVPVIDAPPATPIQGIGELPPVLTPPPVAPPPTVVPPLGGGEGEEGEGETRGPEDQGISELLNEDLIGAPKDTSINVGFTPIGVASSFGAQGFGGPTPTGGPGPQGGFGTSPLPTSLPTDPQGINQLLDAVNIANMGIKRPVVRGGLN